MVAYCVAFSTSGILSNASLNRSVLVAGGVTRSYSSSRLYGLITPGPISFWIQLRSLEVRHGCWQLIFVGEIQDCQAGVPFTWAWEEIVQHCGSNPNWSLTWDLAWWQILHGQYIVPLAIVDLQAANNNGLDLNTILGYHNKPATIQYRKGLSLSVCGITKAMCRCLADARDIEREIWAGGLCSTSQMALAAAYINAHTSAHNSAQSSQRL